jgi:hypothetical protein
MPVTHLSQGRSRRVRKGHYHSAAVLVVVVALYEAGARQFANDEAGVGRAHV